MFDREERTEGDASVTDVVDKIQNDTKGGGENPLISVVVPVYNVEKYLDRCVQSIVSQTFKSLEIILVDDGARDKSGIMCDTWKTKDDRIRVIHKENGGLSDARNAGVAIARAPYVGFVDSDDYIAPTMYEVLYGSLVKENADIALCGVLDQYVNRSEAPSAIVYSVMTPEEVLSDIFLNKTLMVGVPPRLCSLALMKEVPFPVGKIHEDAFTVVDVFSRVHKIVVDTHPLYVYCHNEGTITSASYNPASMDNIEAWEYCRREVEKKYPALIPDVMFRCYWAHFDVLDGMVLAGKDVDRENEEMIIGYFQQHYRDIVHHPDISWLRKSALRALMVHRSLYRLLVILQRKRIHLN